MNYLISIDASTTKTGVGIFQINTHQLIYKTHKLIKYPEKTIIKKELTKAKRKEEKNKILSKRIDYMIQELFQIINTYNPSAIVIEDSYNGKDSNAFKALCYIIGAVRGESIRTGASFIKKTPTQWRKDLGIKNRNSENKPYKREELKKMSIQYVIDELYIDTTDDEADAICIGLSCKDEV